jgi:3-hydroxybutyryl-CoA dehydratase
LSDPKVGEDLPVVEKTIGTKQIARYAEASGDHNPIHLNAEFAATSQFGGIVAHGMLTLAFVAESLSLAFGRDWIESGKLKVRLKAPAYPGDTVRSWGHVVKEGTSDGRRSLECAVGLKNGKGEELISGVATVTLS